MSYGENDPAISCFKAGRWLNNEDREILLFRPTKLLAWGLNSDREKDYTQIRILNLQYNLPTDDWNIAGGVRVAIESPGVWHVKR